MTNSIDALTPSHGMPGTGLIRPLFEGPLDVIGDVHGELDALTDLMTALGYDANGEHPDGRRLVFVGDLCDRGPNSPGVLRWVQKLVAAGKAQAIAGNHELNLLRREEKHGNDWFFGHAFHKDFGACEAIGKSEQEPILDFLRTLPVALERSDLRIVHAAWIPDAVERCREKDLPLDAAFAFYEETMQKDPVFQDLKARSELEKEQLGDALKIRGNDIAPPAAAIGAFDEYCQMANPIRTMTSGVEAVSQKPFYANGQWRYVDRVAWWVPYNEDVPVLFGHYWRWWNPSVRAAYSKGEPDLFREDPVGPFMAEHHRAFCIDFSVGGRYKQRSLNHEPPYHARLAAMRWPERTLVFDGDDPIPVTAA